MRATLLIGLLALFACRGPAAEGDLLTAIVETQQQVQRVQGEYRQATTSADAPDAEPNVYQVRFFLEMPDRYHLEYVDADDPTAKEWWLSDGEVQTHAEQIDPDIDPIVSTKPVDEDSWGFQRVADFFRLDREALGKDFAMTARPVDAIDGVDEATAAVELVPKGGRMAEELQRISVIVGADHRTRRIVILDQQDNVITIDVVAADYGSAIDPAVFSWGPPDE